MTSIEAILPRPYRGITVMNVVKRHGLNVALIVALGAAGTVSLTPQARSQARTGSEAGSSPSAYQGYQHRPGSAGEDAAEDSREGIEDRQLDQRARRIDDKLLGGGGICSGWD